jgi:hypothetical protein
MMVGTPGQYKHKHENMEQLELNLDFSLNVFDTKSRTHLLGSDKYLILKKHNLIALTSSNEHNSDLYCTVNEKVTE